MPSARAALPLTPRVLASLRTDCGVPEGTRVGVAVSGGVDSIVLWAALRAEGVDVVALHVDHGLRAGSGEDRAWVEAQADAWATPCVVRSVAVAPGNVQAEARRARYGALAAMAREAGCVPLATAHTATDQAETVLLALTQGAGLAGLGGIAPRRPLGADLALVRPMLDVTRAEVDAWARTTGLSWRDDPSNATDAYARNRLRHAVLPLLEADGGPDVTRRIARAASAARAARALGPAACLDALSREDARLDLAGLSALPTDQRALLWAEALALWAPQARRSRALVARLDALLDAPVGQRVDAAGAVVWREADALRFGRPAAPPPVSAAAPPWTLTWGGGTLTAVVLDDVPTRLQAAPSVALLDAGAVAAGVQVRGWQAGDRIAPLGMEGSRRVADVLAEAGVPAADRPSWPLVVAPDGTVLWVVGHRVGRAGALTDRTREAVRVAWSPALSGG